MNHWPFITAAYAVTVLGTLGVALWAYWSMRGAEQEMEKL